MPLPDATPPSQSRLYEQLKTLKLESLTADQLDKWRDQIYADPDNEDEIRRLILLYIASGRFSIPGGPMIRTATIEQVTRTSDTGLFTIFKPETGSCYQFNGGDLLASGGTASCNFYLYDGSVQTYIGSASTSGQEPLPTDTYGLRTPFWVTSDMYFAGDLTAIVTSARITAAFIRVS